MMYRIPEVTGGGLEGPANTYLPIGTIAIHPSTLILRPIAAQNSTRLAEPLSERACVNLTATQSDHRANTTIHFQRVFPQLKSVELSHLRYQEA